jgi:hypothetical protein
MDGGNGWSAIDGAQWMERNRPWIGFSRSGRRAAATDFQAFRLL